MTLRQGSEYVSIDVLIYLQPGSATWTISRLDECKLLLFKWKMYRRIYGHFYKGRLGDKDTIRSYTVSPKMSTSYK